jgi:hypothetical protein
MIELTPQDVLRLRGLGIDARPEVVLPDRSDKWMETYAHAILLAQQSESRAWSEARRWRAWGWMGLACGAAGIAASILAAVARRGGW